MNDPRIQHFFRPTIDGPRIIKVGASSYGIPEDSEVRQVRLAHGRAAYVLTAGMVHLLDEQSEVVVADSLRAAIWAQYFPATPLNRVGP